MLTVKLIIYLSYVTCCCYSVNECWESTILLMLYICCQLIYLNCGFMCTVLSCFLLVPACSSVVVLLHVKLQHKEGSHFVGLYVGSVVLSFAWFIACFINCLYSLSSMSASVFVNVLTSCFVFFYCELKVPDFISYFAKEKYIYKHMISLVLI